MQIYGNKLEQHLREHGLSPLYIIASDEPFWHEDIKILDGQYNYYGDETIVAVAWRELYMGKKLSAQ